MLQYDAETVATEPADQIADPPGAAEPAADLDEHRVGRLIAEDVVDHRHVVDADREECRRAPSALIGRDDLVDRFAQPAFVEMAGEFVVVGQALEAHLLRLAVADRADDAEHDLRPAGIVALGPSALVDPDEPAGSVTQAIPPAERRLA